MASWRRFTIIRFHSFKGPAVAAPPFRAWFGGPASARHLSGGLVRGLSALRTTPTATPKRNGPSGALFRSGAGLGGGQCLRR